VDPARYRTLQEVPDHVFLRPRDIFYLTRSTTSPISPADLRKARLTGAFKCVRFGKMHPFYPAWAVKEFCGVPFERAEISERPMTVSPLLRPLRPLLRLRDVKRLGFSRDRIEDLCRRRRITPFYKKKNSKALYLTWQFNRLVDDVKIQPPPHKRRLRRREVARWLGVTRAEIDSWARLGIVKRRRGYFSRDQIVERVLG
jgi:hypothetical protein